MTERLRQLHEASYALDISISDLRAFVDRHVDSETGDVKPLEDLDRVMVPSMLQRVTIALESLRVLVRDSPR